MDVFESFNDEIVGQFPWRDLHVGNPCLTNRTNSWFMADSTYSITVDLTDIFKHVLLEECCLCLGLSFTEGDRQSLTYGRFSSFLPGSKLRPQLGHHGAEMGVPFVFNTA